MIMSAFYMSAALNKPLAYHISHWLVMEPITMNHDQTTPKGAV